MKRVAGMEILSGIGRSCDLCVVQLRPIDDLGRRASHIVTARAFRDGGFEPIHVARNEELLIAASGDGRIALASPYGHLTEIWDDRVANLVSIESARNFGVIRSIAFVGPELYAVGMAKQIYKFAESTKKWQLLNVDDATARARIEVSGFNAIAGSSTEWFSVGFGGVLATFREGKAVQVESPTNLVLHDVSYDKERGWLVCGQRGVVLFSYPGSEVWQEYRLHEIDEDVLSVRVFEGRHFFLLRTRVLVADRMGGSLEVAPVYCASNEMLKLDAVNNALWLFSAKSAFVTTDGEKWERVASF